MSDQSGTASPLELVKSAALEDDGIGPGLSDWPSVYVCPLAPIPFLPCSLPVLVTHALFGACLGEYAEYASIVSAVG